MIVPTISYLFLSFISSPNLLNCPFNIHSSSTQLPRRCQQPSQILSTRLGCTALIWPWSRVLELADLGEFDVVDLGCKDILDVDGKDVCCSKF